MLAIRKQGTVKEPELQGWYSSYIDGAKWADIKQKPPVSNKLKQEDQYGDFVTDGF